MGNVVRCTFTLGATCLDAAINCAHSIAAVNVNTEKVVGVDSESPLFEIRMSPVTSELNSKGQGVIYSQKVGITNVPAMFVGIVEGYDRCSLATTQCLTSRILTSGRQTWRIK